MHHSIFGLSYSLLLTSSYNRLTPSKLPSTLVTGRHRPTLWQWDNLLLYVAGVFDHFSSSCGRRRHIDVDIGDDDNDDDSRPNGHYFSTQADNLVTNRSGQPCHHLQIFRYLARLCLRHPCFVSYQTSFSGLVFPSPFF